MVKGQIKKEKPFNAFVLKPHLSKRVCYEDGKSGKESQFLNVDSHFFTVFNAFILKTKTLPIAQHGKKTK